MNPKVKKVLALVAAKKAFDQIQQRRRPPEPKSRWGRVVPVAAVAAAACGIAYLAKSGRIGPVVEKVRGRAGSGTPAPGGDGAYRPAAHPVGGPVT